MALAITSATVAFIFVLAMTTSFDFTRWGGAAICSHLLYTLPLSIKAQVPGAGWNHVARFLSSSQVPLTLGPPYAPAWSHRKQPPI